MSIRPNIFIAARRALLALTVVAAWPAQAAFSLGAFETYGLLVNSGVSGGDINTFPVNANIGIGSVGGTVNLHNGIVNGKVDVLGSAAADVSGGNITGTQPTSLGGPVAASVNSNVAAVGTAIADALNLSSSFAALSGTAVTINGTTTINAASGRLDANGNRIFTAASFSIGNGNTVTVNGSASDYVVINVTGGSGNKLDGALTLTGGITADQVLVNFTGSGGNLQGAANKATLAATFLVPNLGVQLNSLTIAGHLFGGASGTNFQFVSNALIAQPGIGDSPGPNTPGSNTSVPEPTSLALVGLALAAATWASRRRARP